MLKQLDNVDYIKNLIQNFKIPQQDALQCCSFSSERNGKTIWHSAIYVSMDAEPDFYDNIFEFWVRAYFCFVEDFVLGYVFLEYANKVKCTSISKKNFKEQYSKVLNSGTPETSFSERQMYAETYVELEKRDFSDAYEMINTPYLKSYTAYSDGNYMAFFQITPETNN
jgi:hypothetical protein